MSKNTATVDTFFNQTSDTAAQPSFEPVVVDIGNLPNTDNNEGGGAREVTSDVERTYKGVHPIAALFHIVFKIGGLLTFLLGNLLLGNYIVVFVITILFVAADFWTTKNITGRLLVSLRWWNEVKEDGSTQWIFESAPESDTKVNAYDNWFFWIVLIAYTAVWLVFCILNLMQLKWLPIAVVGLVLAGANLLGYIKCRSDARKRVSEFVTSQAMQRPQLAGQVASNFFGAFNSVSK